MSQVITTCKKCGLAFKWFMEAGAEMPDCPQCGSNPIKEHRDSGVEQLLADLEGSDAGKRNNAAVFLGERGERRAIEPLLKIFREERANVPAGVLNALGDLKEERAIDLILELMPDSDLDSNAHMLGMGTKALAKIGTKRVLNTVMKNLRYLCVPWPVEVKEALKAFVEVGEDAILVLLEGLDIYRKAGSCSVPVRKEIIWALGEIGDKRLIENVKPFLSDKNSQLAQAAKDALVMLEWQPSTDDEEVLFLVEQCKIDELKAKGKNAIRPLARMLMSGISRKTKQKIANLLSEMSWEPSTIDERIAILIARGDLKELAKLGPCAKDAMVNAMMDDDYEDSLKIPEALIELNDPGIYDVILHAFKQVHCSELSLAAAKALGLLGDKRAAEHLVKDLKTSWADEELRCACANALGDMLDQSSLGVLEAVAAEEHQDERVKASAQAAIEKIKKGLHFTGEDAGLKDKDKKASKDIQEAPVEIDTVECTNCKTKTPRSEADANKGICNKCAWEKSRVSCKNCENKVIRSIWEKNKGLCVNCIKDEAVVKKFGKKKWFFQK